MKCILSLWGKEIRMRKIIGFVSLALAAGLCGAEDIQFATVLSSPVGSFTNLETSSTTQAQSGRVNFCNSRANSGTITLSGTVAPSLGDITLGDHANMNFEGVSQIKAAAAVVKNGGTLSGKALYAQLQPVNTNRGSGHYSLPARPMKNYLKAAELYVSSPLVLEGVATQKLYLGGGCPSGNTYCNSLPNSSGSSSAASWTNEYQADYTQDSEGNWVSHPTFDSDNSRDYKREFLLQQGTQRTINPNWERYLEYTETEVGRQALSERAWLDDNKLELDITE